MSRRSPLSLFRGRQRAVQLLVSTVSPAIVLLKTGKRQGDTADIESRFRVLGARGSSYEVSVQERWWAASQVAPQRYAYQVSRAEGPEIISFHLHPGASAGVTHHLHLGAGAGSLMPELATAHVPTGPVSAGRFVRFLVEDLGVRTVRADWRAVLEQFDA